MVLTTADYKVADIELAGFGRKEISLAEPPIAIGSMRDGSFYITHDAGLGLVTFLDPKTNDTRTVSGFATLGLGDPVELMNDKKGGK